MGRQGIDEPCEQQRVDHSDKAVGGGIPLQAREEHGMVRLHLASTGLLAIRSAKIRRNAATRPQSAGRTRDGAVLDQITDTKPIGASTARAAGLAGVACTDEPAAASSELRHAAFVASPGANLRQSIPNARVQSCSLRIRTVRR